MSLKIYVCRLQKFRVSTQKTVLKTYFAVSVYRKATSPLKLKDGDVLPTGSYVCVPSIDPEADPTTLSRDFDGFRWARLREIPGNENKYLSVTTGSVEPVTPSAFYAIFYMFSPSISVY